MSINSSINLTSPDILKAKKLMDRQAELVKAEERLAESRSELATFDATNPDVTSQVDERGVPTKAAKTREALATRVASRAASVVEARQREDAERTLTDREAILVSVIPFSEAPLTQEEKCSTEQC